MKIQNDFIKAVFDEVYEYLHSQGSYREMFNADFSKGKLPEASIDKVMEAEKFASIISEKISDFRASGKKIDHYDEMMLQTMEFYCSANFFISGCENPAFSDFIDLNFSIAPNNSPLFFINCIADIDTLASEDNSMRFLNLVSQYPRLVQDCLGRTEHQLSNKVYMPLLTTNYAIEALQSLAIDGQKNCLYITANQLFPTLKNREELAEKSNHCLAEAISGVKELISILKSENYQQSAPRVPGLMHYPKGVEYYQKLADFHCSRHVDLDELYTFAENRIVKLKKKVEEIIYGLGFNMTAEEFFNVQCYKIPELFDSNAEQVDQRYRACLERIKPHLPDFFEKIPKAGCNVEPQPAGNEASTGLFAAPNPEHPEGRYLYATANLEKQNQIWAAALIYHELLPGHHFQMSLTLEDDTLHPLIRSLYYITSYGEGWADYASFTAEDMGLYKDPMDMLGRLYNEIRHTTQILMDIGINARGWTEEEAIACYQKYTGADRSICFSAVSRFGNDIQGQGLSYSVGSTYFQTLRKKAEKELGNRFDIREFHTRLLELGSVPLAVLGNHIDWYIQQKKAET